MGDELDRFLGFIALVALCNFAIGASDEQIALQNSKHHFNTILDKANAGDRSLILVEDVRNNNFYSILFKFSLNFIKIELRHCFIHSEVNRNLVMNFS